MAWTTPAVRATGDVISAATWNTDIKDNLRFLKGIDGTITLEDLIASDTHNIDDIGTGVINWRNVFAMRYFMGGRRVHFAWENATLANSQVTATASGAGSSVNPGGSGQWVLGATGTSTGAARIEAQAEQNSALANGWAIARNPALDITIGYEAVSDTEWDAFVGFRGTIGGTTRPADTEHQAGFHFDGTNWFAKVSDGATATNGATFTLAAGNHKFQIIIKSGVRVEFFVDGVNRGNLTTTLPTANQTWEVLWATDSAGDASIRRLTVGELTVQEQP